MALQNLSIYNAMISIGTLLKTDTEVSAFCKERFDVEYPKVMVGDMTRRDIPGVAETPYIVVTDFTKQEGQNIEFCPYEFTIWVGVAKEDNAIQTVDGVEVIDGYKDCADLMTLIEGVLNEPLKNNRPCSKVNTNGPFPIDPAGKHWVGKMTVNKRIYQTLGTSYQEEL